MGKVVRIRASVIIRKNHYLSNIKPWIWQQKFVLRLCVEDAMIRTKAYQCIAKFNGVGLMSIVGNQLTVGGEGIDPVFMLIKLRKEIGSTQIQMIAVNKGQKEKENKTDKGKEQVNKDETNVVANYIAPSRVMVPYYVETPVHENCCPIL